MANTTSHQRRKSLRRLTVVLGSIYGKLSEDLLITPFDKKYLLKRINAEGYTFVTKTLPLFSSWVLKELENPGVKPPTNFEKRRKATSPRFLSELVDKARLGDPQALFRIRQLCDYSYKLVLEPTNSTIWAAVTGYEERQARVAKYRPEKGWVDAMHKNACAIYPFLWKSTADQVLEQYRPFDTNGSCLEYAGMLKVLKKYPEEMPPGMFKKLPDCVHRKLPEKLRSYAGYWKSFPRNGRKNSDWTNNGDFVTDMHCKVAFVPKDSRGPRVISMEPNMLLRGQMAVHEFLKENLQRSTRGRVQFTSQESNQQLAKASSINRANATLDLKDASDNVSLALVRGVFRHSPVMRFAEKLRSTHWLYENHELEIYKSGVLSSWANMGSGLCFPTLAMVVHLSAVTGVKITRRRMSVRDISDRIYVYGDDLICPAEWVDDVVQGLMKSGLVVNLAKSFRNGFFRESCGGDYYHGSDVAPVRLKLSHAEAKYIGTGADASLVPTGAKSQSSYALQLERHCRELVRKDLFNLAEYYYSRLEGAFGPFPDIHEESPYFGRVFPLGRGITTGQCFKPVPLKADGTEDVSQVKGMAQALSRKTVKPPENQYGEFGVPRYVKLRRQKINQATRLMYGLPDFDLSGSLGYTHFYCSLGPTTAVSTESKILERCSKISAYRPKEMSEDIES